MTNRTFFLLFLAIAIVYVIAMQINVIDVDASQYASMSLELLNSGNYLEFTDRGLDYLDKPPLLFWLNALSINILGVSNFAYKLPSVLACILAIFSVYKIAKLYYSHKVGLWSSLIFASSQALFIITNDVRTDNLLLGFSTFSVWQLLLFTQRNNWKNLFLSGIGLGFAMLAKGPFGLIFPLAVVGFHLLLKRDFKSIFNWKWIVMLIVTFIILIPMCIGLYNQWDIHPEKSHFHIGEFRKGVSGLWFFFWEQSFGRITGENGWSNNADPFFLLHSFAWAFIPWTILFLFSFISTIKNWIKNKFSPNSIKEGIGIGGYVIATITLSQSNYQLPHYIFIATPFAAILIGGYLDQLDLNGKTKKVLNTIHLALPIVLLVFILGLVQFSFGLSIGLGILYLILIVGFFLWFKKEVDSFKFVFACGLASIVVNLIIHLSFYPSLLKYQASSEMGLFVKEQGMSEKTAMYIEFGRAQDFYAEHMLPYYHTMKQIDALNIQDSLWVYIDASDLNQFDHFKPTVVKEFEHYNVQFLKKEFLNPTTRAQVLDKKLIICLKP